VFVFYIFIARDILKAINACENLHFLNLEGNTLGVDAAKGIAKTLESHSEFKRALWKDMFTGRTKTEIPKALVSTMTVNNNFLGILCVCVCVCVCLGLINSYCVTFLGRD
jgi:hypothetical protein